MTIKLGNFANFIVRNFVVIWGAPIFHLKICYCSWPPSTSSKDGDREKNRKIERERESPDGGQECMEKEGLGG